MKIAATVSCIKVLLFPRSYSRFTTHDSLLHSFTFSPAPRPFHSLFPNPWSLFLPHPPINSDPPPHVSDPTPPCFRPHPPMPVCETVKL